MNGEQSKQILSLVREKGFTETIMFIDQAGTPYSDYEFSAETTLFGVTMFGPKTIASFSWGYRFENGVISTFGPEAIETPESHQTILTIYNSIQPVFFTFP